MTVREITYIVLDELKNISDDKFFEEEHILFLLGKYRAFVLKQKYGTDIKKAIPESNYQTLCLDLEEALIDDNVCYTGPRLVSAIEVPSMMGIGSKRIFTTTDFSTIYFTLVSRDRFNYVGFNKWMKNIIYAAIGPDHRLYFKSNNPQHLYLDKVRLNGVFEDFEKASELECENKTGEECSTLHILDREFPIEDSLVPPVIELVLKELSQAIYRPTDTVNNASDDLAKVQPKQ